MTIEDWTGQPVTQSKGWNVKRIIAEQDRQRVPLTSEDLQTQLIDTADALKHDQTTTVARLILDNHHYILKRYNARSQWHRFNRLLRQSRASRCWQMSYAFKHAGLNVARPVMMLEHRFGPFRRKAYFLNQWINGEELLQGLPKMSRDEQILVADAVKLAFTRMQDALLTHGDMKATNLIWLDEKLYFIDLDAAQQHRSMRSWQKSHRKDRQRFMKNWATHPDLLSLFNERL